jgi:hypothetical protein
VALEASWQGETVENFVIFGENWMTALRFLVGSVVLGSQEAVKAVKFLTLCFQSQVLEMEWAESLQQQTAVMQEPVELQEAEAHCVTYVYL